MGFKASLTLVLLIQTVYQTPAANYRRSHLLKIDFEAEDVEQGVAT